MIFVFPQAGYFCRVCDCVVKDSANYLDHINGKKTSKGIGDVYAGGEIVT
jgi:U4/U6.U5 tri-snRNP component SNU23